MKYEGKKFHSIEPHPHVKKMCHSRVYQNRKKKFTGNGITTHDGT